ncbi:helix-turn-helix domain-containing protein [Mesorhizobium sp. B2-3-5]|uniref:helix-turn-helix transcriptional regulator n=1 Tax=Mesorhizobium sp. B2-3-5 TaxID=2589958 RepID=UPI00112BAF90|nr:helix-turn-helix domain-containing protein [Mesorhizobium sp. B2-3-5]TPM36644.1 helix-turn-helix domain-containing protein [Mesorhizobium sp. B2-3-5]
MTPNKLLLPADAGILLGPEGHPVPVATLQWWRTKGRGPRYINRGGRIFYREADLHAFIEAGVTDPKAVA